MSIDWPEVVTKTGGDKTRAVPRTFRIVWDVVDEDGKVFTTKAETYNIEDIPGAKVIADSKRDKAFE